jgi:hypothetical protein
VWWGAVCTASLQKEAGRQSKVASNTPPRLAAPIPKPSGSAPIGDKTREPATKRSRFCGPFAALRARGEGAVAQAPRPGRFACTDASPGGCGDIGARDQSLELVSRALPSRGRASVTECKLSCSLYWAFAAGRRLPAGPRCVLFCQVLNATLHCTIVPLGAETS